MKRNTRANYQKECMGLRIVSMYVQEFFWWGWQQYDQENDDGIDGEIIIRGRDGYDLGCRIFVQIKCGNGYLKKEDDDFIYIAPYDKQNLQRHLEAYARQVEPVILVYVNPTKKDSSGRIYEDLINPSAWWVRMDTMEYDNTSYVKIPKSQTWGQHSKGALFSLVRNIIKDWNHYPLIIADEDDRKLFYSTKLKEDATLFYKELSNKDIKWDSYHSKPSIKFTRIGWRHINKSGRGKIRISNSLKLLSIVVKVLQNDKVGNALLKEKVYNHGLSFIRFYGLRARVNIGREKYKIQVVVRKWHNAKKDLTSYWFYSVHIIK